MPGNQGGTSCSPITSSSNLNKRNPAPMRLALCGLVAFSFAVSGIAYSPAAYAQSCASATRALTNIQKGNVKKRRAERGIRNELDKVRGDFAKAQKQRKKWERSASRNKCNKKGANAGRCAKAEKEVRFWKKQMRSLQREEEKLLRQQRRNGMQRALAKEEAAEKVRQASCNGLPAPRRPTLTAEERLAREAAGAAIGILLGTIANRTQRGGAPGNKCHRNPTTGLMHCSGG